MVAVQEVDLLARFRFRSFVVIVMLHMLRRHRFTDSEGALSVRV